MLFCPTCQKEVKSNCTKVILQGDVFYDYMCPFCGTELNEKWETEEITASVSYVPVESENENENERETDKWSRLTNWR